MRFTPISFLRSRQVFAQSLDLSQDFAAFPGQLLLALAVPQEMKERPRPLPGAGGPLAIQKCIIPGKRQSRSVQTSPQPRQQQPRRRELDQVEKRKNQEAWKDDVGSPVILVLRQQTGDLSDDPVRHEVIDSAEQGHGAAHEKQLQLAEEK